MSLTADEQARFLASLREDPAFLAQVRQEVLTSELAALPERFAAFVEEMHAFVEEMHAFVEEMHAFRDEIHALVEAINRRLDAADAARAQLANDTGKLKGMFLEYKVRTNPGYFLGAHARKVRLLELDDLLEHEGVDDLSRDEYDTLRRTDVLARGIARRSGEPAVIVVETTWRVYRRDVDRQVVKRGILANHHVPALAVIASVEEPTPEVRRYAEMNQVVVEWDETDTDAA